MEKNIKANGKMELEKEKELKLVQRESLTKEILNKIKCMGMVNTL